MLKSRLGLFFFCREESFLSLCKIEKNLGRNLVWQSDVKRRERFWFWATFHNVGKWEWMMLAALQIGSGMKLCRNTTWRSCNQWKRLHEVMWPYHVTSHVIGHVTMQALYIYRIWILRQSRWTLFRHFRVFAFFLGLCNSNPFNFFYTANYRYHPVQASRLVNSIYSSFVKY